ncbi:peptidase C14, caspase domain-containing protein [Fomes fomentarius]|nr:peptidase C14, caspase domain-containing protein [Fomes fomentarius]
MVAFSKTTRSSTLNLAKTPKRKPARKALVVGIEYKGVKDNDIPELRFPHKDARDWKQLLISKYKYAESDITIMLDHESTDARLKPTRENLWREIGALVKGARPGDRFMFYYAGHSDQVRSNSVSEKDGLDEAIVPYAPPGSKVELIIDNDLRALLVDPLPVGASLIAVFDTCHSGTLLDLEHDLCNQVWFPWRKRGTPYSSTRSSRSTSCGVKTQDSEAIKLDLAMEEAADTGSDSDGEKPPVEPRKPSLRIYERKRKSEHVMFQCNTLVEDDSVEPTRAGEKESRRFVITRSSTMQATRQGSFSFADARKPRRVFSFDHLTLKGVVASAFGVFKRCGEPDSMFEVECDGWCKPRTRKTKAHVVSIAACQDPQQTWESRNGWTMTQSLITFLRKFHDSTPYPFIPLSRSRS